MGHKSITCSTWRRYEDKLYAKKEDHIDGLVQTVHTCSADIGREFSITKCAGMTKCGQLVKSCGLELPSGESESVIQKAQDINILGSLTWIRL